MSLAVDRHPVLDVLGSPRTAELVDDAVLFGYVGEATERRSLRPGPTALSRRRAAATHRGAAEQQARQVGSSLPAGLSVSSVRAYPDSVYVYGADTFAGVVLADAAIDVAVPTVGFDGFGAELSLEQVGELTADVLIVWTANEDDPAAVEDQLRASPLWDTLPAVQAGRAVFGGQYWIGSGLYAARAVFGDLRQAFG